MRKTCCGKSVSKDTDLNKTFTFFLKMCYFLYFYHKIIISKSFSTPNLRKCKIKMVIILLKWQDMEINVLPLFSKPNMLKYFMYFMFNIDVLM